MVNTFMKIKKIFIFIFTVMVMVSFVSGKSNATIVDDYLNQLRALDDEQKKALIEFTLYGKTSGHGYNLAAIAFIESKLCRKVVNPTDGKMGSYGCMQVQAFYDAKQRKMKTDDATIKHLAKKHVNNRYYNVRSADSMLKYWLKVHNGDRLKALASYNAGNIGIRSKAGRSYAKKVIHVSIAIYKLMNETGLQNHIDEILKIHNGKDVIRVDYNKVLAYLK